MSDYEPHDYDDGDDESEEALGCVLWTLAAFAVVVFGLGVLVGWLAT